MVIIIKIEKHQAVTKAICNAEFSGYFNRSSSLQHRQFVFDDLAMKTKYE
jgi:hypothetical protein